MYDYLSENSRNSIIAEQIGVLYSLGILKHHNYEDDARDSLIREVLEMCTNEIQMMNVLHDIKTGNETIEAMLIRKGLLQ